ncbi:MAG: MFS transporter [Rhodospirillaceae bacterium]|nr:MFS transporter [Rhodospirillaceae bacterium]MBT5191866.1 MFS transporter [Rhodospirillaceae bacterium]MBT5897362.1 MFS transporter [Rhodospirillaceae bacterium]MBT6430848.1 MFS transporter [Rhodospirillaceae bacterium]MBT7755795.1 MFS transporter [Rhodospirillaceae bacterium]
MSTIEPEKTEAAPATTMARAMFLVFMPFAGGYFFSYFFRSVNAVVAPYLRQDIGLGPADLGLMSAAYFLTFAAFQIPLGLLLDRYGPRRVQGTLYCVAALGALLFSMAENVSTLILARALIGFGVSGGLMAALKAIVMWFPLNRIALVNGWYLACGGLGVLGATGPVEVAMQSMDWRQMFMALAAITLVAGVLILLVVPERPDSAATGTLGEQVREIGQIFRDPYFWRITPLMFTCSAAYMAIQGLWAGLWLTEVDGFSQADTASHLTIMAIGMIVGVMGSGVFAALLMRMGFDMVAVCGFSAAFSISGMLLLISDILPSSYVLWGFVGLVVILTALVFAALTQHFPLEQAARANTAANVLVFGMAFTYQWGIGWVIEMWPAMANGSYPRIAYIWAFIGVTATQVLAFIWYAWPRRR